MSAEGLGRWSCGPVLLRNLCCIDAMKSNTSLEAWLRFWYRLQPAAASNKLLKCTMTSSVVETYPTNSKRTWKLHHSTPTAPFQLLIARTHHCMYHNSLHTKVRQRQNSASDSVFRSLFHEPRRLQHHMQITGKIRALNSNGSLQMNGVCAGCATNACV